MYNYANGSDAQLTPSIFQGFFHSKNLAEDLVCGIQKLYSPRAVSTTLMSVQMFYKYKSKGSEQCELNKIAQICVQSGLECLQV